MVYRRTTFECVNQSPQSVPGSIANTNGALFYHVEVKCNGIPCPPYDTQKEVYMCCVHKVTFDEYNISVTCQKKKKMLQ